MNVLFLLIGIVFFESLSFARHVHERIGMFAASDPHSISNHSFDLYREAKRTIADFHQWQVEDSQIILNSLDKEKDRFAIGNIPTIHPHFLDKAIRGRNAPFSKVKVLPIQGTLDTLLLDAAIIAECRENAAKLATSCHLYFYDRSHQRIMAVAEKRFSKPIANVSAWGVSLASNLYHGLKERKLELGKEKMKGLLNNSEQTETRKPFIALTIFNQAIGQGTRTFKSVPGLYATLGFQGETYSYGITGGSARAVSKESSEESKLLERFGGLALAARTRALESIYWDLGITILYTLRSVSHESFSEHSSSQQEDESVKFQLHPGLSWKVYHSVLLNMGVFATKDSAIATRRVGVFENESTETSGLGFEIGTRAEF